MTAASPERVRVLGTPVDCVDMQSALAVIEERVRHAQSPSTVVAVNPEKVYALRESPFLRQFFERATLLIPDGIGIVKAVRFLHKRNSSRVPGADLMQRICAEAPAKGYRIFIYGAKEEVNREAVEILCRRHPGIQIVGRANGYVAQDEMDTLVERINESGAEILFVGLGSPRQEQWMSDHLGALSVKVCQGIGGTLDTITGAVKRAPRAYQALGLEWLYRLLSQPSRAGRQMTLVWFVLKVLEAKIQDMMGSNL